MAIRDLIPWSRHDASYAPTRLSSPLEPLRDLGRVFDNFFGEGDLWPTWPTHSGDSFVPSMEVTETDKDLKVMADLPGMDEKDIHVDLTDDGLTIRGERKSEHEEKHEGYHRSERCYGSFERFISLPVSVVGDQATAEFKNGVLTVTLPKSPEVQAKRKGIEVKKG